MTPFPSPGEVTTRFTFNSASAWFDLQQFKGTHEQAGYPLLLSWMHQFVGDSLYYRKALNVFVFLMLALVWFEIGKEIGGQSLGFVFASGILLATPLWFYWMFLLKDMTITFLQSLFILGLIQLLSHRSVVRTYGLLALSTLLTIPFRSQLALVNLAALAGTTFLGMGSGRSWKRSLLKIVMMGGMFLALLVVGKNPEILNQLGVRGEHQALDAESVQAEVEFRGRSRTAQFANVLIFPVLYLMGEVAAFNPKIWGDVNIPLLRGLSMVPWIYIGVPLFVSGAWMIVWGQRFREGAMEISTAEGEGHRVDQVRPARAQLLVLLMFSLIYAGVSWISADTTRWRIPAMPSMVAIAGFAWIALRKQQRFGMLLGWGLLLSVSLLTYYSLFK
jgi:hypothetical protein